MSPSPLPVRRVKLSLTWPLPAYLETAKMLLRADADGITPMEHQRADGRISVRTLCGPANVFILSPDPNAADLETLRALAVGSR